MVYVRCVFPYTPFASSHLRWTSFLDGKVNSTDEPIPRAALRETEEVGIGDDKVEILGSLVGQRGHRAAPESSPVW